MEPDMITSKEIAFRKWLAAEMDKAGDVGLVKGDAIKNGSKRVRCKAFMADFYVRRLTKDGGRYVIEYDYSIHKARILRRVTS